MGWKLCKEENMSQIMERINKKIKRASEERLRELNMNGGENEIWKKNEGKRKKEEKDG